MELFTVKFGDVRLGRFINEELKNRGYVSIYEENDKNGENYVRVAVEKGIMHAIIATATVVFYKKRIIDKEFTRKNDLYSAFCGVIVGQDFDKEKIEVMRRIPDCTTLSVSGIYDFLLADLEYSWRALAFLANKLYSECASKDDVFALIKYFLSGEILLSKTAILNGGITLDGENRKINLAEVFDKDCDNVAFNLMLIKPVEIIVPRPNDYPDDLITLIKRLGEG